MKLKKIIPVLLSLVLVLASPAYLAGCGRTTVSLSSSGDLSEGLSVEGAEGRAADDEFIRSQMRFYVDLFRDIAVRNSGKNTLISPLSIAVALAMTANGAAGETRTEMEILLGSASIAELNEYLCAYARTLSFGDGFKFGMENSIWFRDDENRLQVEKDFLETNLKYYGADAYKSPFDAGTLRDINNWVRDRTDGMVDSILDEISPEAVMYLLSAVVFDAEWDTAYSKDDIHDGEFTSAAGDKNAAEMMHSIEAKYLDDGFATGFIKDYKGQKYSFAALVPNEGTDLDSYLIGLHFDRLLATLRGAASMPVMVKMPKFSYDYSQSMNKILSRLGMPSAFMDGTADFSGIDKSAGRSLFIGDVLHKTYITVDELGTKAGAVTKVEINDEAAPYAEKNVTLDRPFVYMIIDNATNLPVFMGTVENLQNGDDGANVPENSAAEPDDSPNIFYGFDAQYFRTHESGIRGRMSPYLDVIRSADELHAYIEKHSDAYTLEEQQHDNFPTISNNSPTALETLAKYDDAYFSDRSLILAIIWEPSSSILHTVASVGVNNKTGRMSIYFQNSTHDTAVTTMEALWFVIIEPEAGTPVPDSDLVSLYIDGRKTDIGKREIVKAANDHANIRLILPEGWKYETGGVSDGDDCELFVSFWPDSEPRGKITVKHTNHFDKFGEDAGYTERQTSINNFTAFSGRLDGRKKWDYIRTTDAAGQYVILSEGAGIWPDDVRKEAEEIIRDTLKIGQGFLGREGARRVVLEDIGAVSFDRGLDFRFDCSEGMWYVYLSASDPEIGSRCYQIDLDGNIVNIVYDAVFPEDE